jgi:G3E family GTPase
MDEEVREKARLDAVVTVADAKHLMARLADAPEAEDQIGFADVILLNKTDLASEAELASLEERIRAINNHAIIHRTERCALPLDRVLDRGAFDLERILSIDPDFGESADHGQGDHHHHDHDHHDHHDHDGHDGHDHARHDNAVASVSLRAGALDPDVFFPWISRTTQEFGPDILRLKGILAFRDDPARFVLQGIHMIVEGDHQRPWRDGESRESRLVFIGRNLDPDMLKTGFEACVA